MPRTLTYQACILFAVLLFSAVSGLPAGAYPAVVVVVDGSASMWEKIDGRDKIELVRETAARVMEGLPSEVPLGLVAFGHRRRGDCGDVEVLRSPGADRAGIDGLLGDVWPKGKTPLASALEAAAEILPANGGRILFIGDGGDSCGRDPVSVAEDLRRSGRNIAVDVSAVFPAEDAEPVLKSLAEKTGGSFFVADSAASLRDAPGIMVSSLSRPLPAASVAASGSGVSAAGSVSIQTAAKPREVPADTSSCGRFVSFPSGADGDRHGDDCACATRIRTGEPISGLFQSGSDRDVFRLDVEKAGRLAIRMKGGRVRTAVYDDWCSPADGPSSDGMLDVVPGTLFIETISAGGTGGYILSVESVEGDSAGGQAAAASMPAASVLQIDDYGNSCPCAAILPLGEEKGGELQYARDADAFVVDVPEAGRLAVYTMGSTLTEGVLLDDWCDVVASDSGSGGNGNFRIERDVKPGRVYVAVSHPQKRNGAYRIKAELLVPQSGGINLSGTWRWIEVTTENTMGLGDMTETGTAVFTHKGNTVDIVYDTGSVVRGTLDGMSLHYNDEHVDEGTTVTEDVRVEFSSPTAGKGIGEWVLTSPFMNGKGKHDIVFEKISD